MFQSVPTASSFFTGDHPEESGSIFFTLSHQLFINISQDPLPTTFFSFTLNKSTSLPLLMTNSVILKAFHCPLLDFLQYNAFSPVPGSPELDAALHVNLASGKKRGKMTLLDMMAMICLRQPSWSAFQPALVRGVMPSWVQDCGVFFC